jgi:sigma-B regulation protein RsbU (phosphoserine phosphatase)
MYSEFLDQLRTGLTEKKANLTDWLETASPDEKKTHLGTVDEQAVHAHLEVIESSLDKVEGGIFGLCEICHEDVDTPLLEMDYTSSICLGHFTPQEVESLELELELAQTVQKSLLPQQIPDSPYLDIAAFSRPAQVIGGDYFDFFQFADGRQGFAVADVAGHGISAALHMASIQALLRTLIPTSNSPAAVVQHIHRLLIHNLRFANFVTLFLAAYDPDSDTLTYCNAGHNPPLLLGSGGNGVRSSRWLDPTGPAVGLVEGMIQGEAAVQVSPGDILVMYTDGITEAMDAQGEQFGYERLARVVNRWANGSSSELVQHIRQELQEFTLEEALADDTTILACRFLS